MERHIEHEGGGFYGLIERIESEDLITFRAFVGRPDDHGRYEDEDSVNVTLPWRNTLGVYARFARGATVTWSSVGSRPLRVARAYSELLLRAVAFAEAEESIWRRAHHEVAHVAYCHDRRPRCMACGQHASETVALPVGVRHTEAWMCEPPR